MVVPQISSIENNEIKNIFSISSIPYEIRAVALTGDFVRLFVTKDYVEINSYKDFQLQIDFEKLKNFFYSSGYVFGVVTNNELFVYDVYTNDNYLSQKDLEIFSAETGIHLVKTFYIGKLTAALALEMIINYKEDIHFLPAVYVNVKSSFPNTKIIYGEKKKTPQPTVCYSNATTCSEPTVCTEPTYISEPVPYWGDYKNYTTKQERKEIYEKTYKNISEYISKKKLSKDVENWWHKYGKTVTYAYAVHTLPKTRFIVYDIILDNEAVYATYNTPIEDKWADTFLTLFSESGSPQLKAVAEDLISFSSMTIIFKEEFSILNSFYEVEEKGEYYV